MILSYVKPTPFEWILIMVYLVVFVVGIGGNFLVCFAVWKNHSMRTVTNYFIGEPRHVHVEFTSSSLPHCVHIVHVPCTHVNAFMFSERVILFRASNLGKPTMFFEEDVGWVFGCIPKL